MEKRSAREILEDNGKKKRVCQRCLKNIRAKTYNYCPYCGIKLLREGYEEDCWIDGYYIGNGV